MSLFVFSNLATSIDGKIATPSREHFPLGTPADRRLMLKLRARADAVIQGAGTLRAYRRPLLATGVSKHPLNVVVSSMLDGISPRWPFFTDPRTRKILFVSHRARESRVRLFSKALGNSGEIFRLKPPTSRNPIAAQIIRQLEKLGVRRLLVEGGGGLMWDFVQPNLIDEIYLTLTPRIIGGGGGGGGGSAPSLVDGPGFSPSQVVNLKLRSCRRLGDEVYLVYSKTGRRGP